MRLVLTVISLVLVFAAATTFAQDRWLNYTAGRHAQAIALEGDQYVWCGGSGGVARFDVQTGDKVVYTRADGLAKNDVLAMAIDSDGSKWFGTWWGGVSTLYPDGSWTTYNRHNSALDCDHVQTIAIASDGSKWFGTSTGGVSVLIPAAVNPTMECSLNESEFAPGDDLGAVYEIENMAADVTVDVYFAFVFPDGAILCISPDRIAFGIFPYMRGLLLPQGFSMEPTKLLSTLVPGGLPTGNYLFAAALSNPGGFEAIGELSLFPFAITY